MTLQEFIEKYTFRIDTYIKVVCPNIGEKLDDEERELWIRNDAALYALAEEKGVKEI